MSDRVCEEVDYGEGKIGVMFHCPGCGYCHAPVIKADEGPLWKFNGDFIKPTFTPSIRVTAAINCHSYVTDGQIRFLNDCDHELAGQTVPLQEWDDNE